MSQPKFDPREYPMSLVEPLVLGDAGAWVEHIPFAFALIDFFKPRTVVELGTHWGDSYLAFCQALVMRKLSAKCWAVDTWQGDPQAGQYGEQVLAALRSNHDQPYGSFSTLLQMTFDEARSKFEDGSIDLLHIDGLHTYEAVSHDFNTWLPKMSSRGVILFHDTQVRLETFGVYKLWAEISGKYPSFEFPFGNGLGVLAVGPEVAEGVAKFVEVAKADPVGVVGHFGRLGSGMGHRMKYEALVRRVFGAQQLLDNWWRQLGVTPNGGTNLEHLLSTPWQYGDRMLGELQTLASADLQFRQQHK